MVPYRVHAPFDRYTVAFEEVGIAFLSEVEWAKPRLFRLHEHREIQLLWILQGWMGLFIQGRHYEAPAGSCYVIPAGVPHSVAQKKDAPRVVFLDLRLATEPPETMVRFLQSFGGQIVYRCPVRRVRTAARELRKAVALNGHSKIARVQAILWEMLYELTRNDDRRAADDLTQATDYRIHLVEAAMKGRIDQPLDVKALAKEANISRSQLTRLYHRYFGVGPAERLRQYRIIKARDLLIGTTLSVKEIARVCGFACPNHFCRVFLKATGATPTEFRTSKRDAAEGSPIGKRRRNR
ncbi:MAG: hypothetical protein KatS3mg105_1904 [Gemmatales bacterium]|nr:MAG: hypothetical protein KatS3mg105_1904 [Gemmatales bacterium]